MVFLGDSTCLCGIRPLQFENSTGMKAYNVGSMGVIGIDGAAVMLRSYLKHHPKPKIAVFAMSPWALGVPLTSTGPAEIRDRFFTCYQQREDSERAPERPLQQQLRDGIWRLYGLLEGGAERYANASIPRRGGLTSRSARRSGSSEGTWSIPVPLPRRSRPRLHARPIPRIARVFDRLSPLARFAREQDVPLLIRLTPSIQDALQRSSLASAPFPPPEEGMPRNPHQHARSVMVRRHPFRREPSLQPQGGRAVHGSPRRRDNGPLGCPCQQLGDAYPVRWSQSETPRLPGRRGWLRRTQRWKAKSENLSQNTHVAGQETPARHGLGIGSKSTTCGAHRPAERSSRAWL